MRQEDGSLLSAMEASQLRFSSNADFELRRYRRVLREKGEQAPCYAEKQMFPCKKKTTVTKFEAS